MVANLDTLSERERMKKICCAIMLVAVWNVSTLFAAETQVFYNAKIYTADAKQSEAEAIVVQDGKIIFVGSQEKALEFEGARIDVGGKRVLPGLIDTHCHLLMVSFITGMKRPDITYEMTQEEILHEVGRFAKEHPNEPVIFGYGFKVVASSRLAKDLDAVVADRPVLLLDSGWHSGWANTKALQVAGITKDTPDPVPGAQYFVRDEEGNPTGGMEEPGPIWLMQDKLLPQNKEVILQQLPNLITRYNSLGFTGVFDAGIVIGSETTAHEALRELEKSNKLSLRFYTCHFVMPYHDLDNVLEPIQTLHREFSSEFIHPTTLKMIYDGTVEAFTAYMADPYNEPGSGTGQPNFKGAVMDIVRVGRQAGAAGLGIHVHAIGDQAIADTLKAFAEMGSVPGGKTMAHCQVLPADGLERWAKQTDVVFQTTPVWLQVDAERFTHRVLGEERVLRQSPLQSLLKHNITITFGSDFPVSDGPWLNPLMNVWYAVNRKTDDGTNIFAPASEYLDVKDSIDAYTINAAKQLNAENEWGSIEVGKSADFIVIDQDILTIDPKKINEIQVQQTYLRGEKVYQKKEAPYRRISATEAKQMMQDTNKYILLDVRTKEEYAVEHIEGTLLIPDYEIGSRAATELPDKNALILIYCRSGHRSADAAHELIKMGYTNVYDFGGIIDWQYDIL